MSAPPYLVTAGGRTYSIVDDLTLKYEVFIGGAVLDEFTRRPVPGLRVEAALPNTNVHVLDTGLFGVAGYAPIVFPSFPTLPATVQVTLNAADYYPRILNVAMSTTFPVAAGQVLLRPTAVRLQGRVVLRSNGSPVPAATIAPNLVTVTLFGAPANFDHLDIAATSVKPCTVLTGFSDALTLPAPTGSDRLTLNSVGTLGAGNVVRVGLAGRREYAVILAQPPGTNDIVLTSRTHRHLDAGDPVEQINPTPGTAVQPTRAIYTGESVVTTNTAAPITGVVEISSSAGVEYHDAGSIISGADGYYVFDGFGGLPSVDLKATNGAPLQDMVTRFVNYSDPVNHQDFRLK